MPTEAFDPVHAWSDAAIAELFAALLDHVAPRRDEWGGRRWSSS
jgi:hypothetical protein